MATVTSLLNSPFIQPLMEEVAKQPVVLTQRARAAAALSYGYEWMDTYDAAQPWLFCAGVAGAIASGYGLYKRRKNPEATVLYSLTGLASVALAYLARPAELRAAPEVADPSNPPTPATAALMGWLDGRVVDLSAKYPGWEAATWRRLAEQMGQGTIAPAVQTLLLQNAR
jgi:hypothetical protein